ncbi:hypothetical protein M514_07750 [Trichuris suis]|uniref:Uncharacterized protein n=1 Tax=Trichuris suis TaxID=68888 RepID=A0A085MRL7_9BILA|nr:hypothetical protein M513_07750 [Trichuris suis]KFD59863.1 hypothetical protein M514_07750 [Trichuris suis]
MITAALTKERPAKYNGTSDFNHLPKLTELSRAAPRWSAHPVDGPKCLQGPDIPLLESLGRLPSERSSNLKGVACESNWPLANRLGFGEVEYQDVEDILNYQPDVLTTE